MKPTELPTNCHDGAPHGASGGAAGTVARPRRTILLVDDCVDTLEPLSRLLKMTGFDVRVARSATEALALAATPKPADLIISDLGLPDRSGTDLMREVKQRHGLPGIAVTG